jgi:hypothetical protein
VLQRTKERRPIIGRLNMKIDLYTKTVLTIIAICLVWITPSETPLLTASAQKLKIRDQVSGTSLKAPFKVVDDKGVTILEVSRKGEYVSLTLSDGDKSLVDLSGSPSGSAIQISDLNEKDTGIFIHADAKDRMIILNGKDFNNRYQLTNSNDGDSLIMNGSKGNSISLGADSDGGDFSLRTTSGGFLLGSRRGETDLFVDGPNGKPGVHLESRWGVSSVNVFSPFPNKGAASLFNNIDGPRLKFTDRKDTQIFQIPAQ